jgi:hypothetical protein
MAVINMPEKLANFLRIVVFTPHSLSYPVANRPNDDNVYICEREIATPKKAK